MYSPAAGEGIIHEKDFSEENEPWPRLWKKIAQMSGEEEWSPNRTQGGLDEEAALCLWCEVGGPIRSAGWTKREDWETWLGTWPFQIQC